MISDGTDQCGDMSDERDCDQHVCLKSQFNCPAHEEMPAFCISAYQKCNKVSDCPGGEDEADCPPVNFNMFEMFMKLISDNCILRCNQFLKLGMI